MQQSFADFEASQGISPGFPPHRRLECPQPVPRCPSSWLSSVPSPAPNSPVRQPQVAPCTATTKTNPITLGLIASLTYSPACEGPM